MSGCGEALYPSRLVCFLCHGGTEKQTDRGFAVPTILKLMAFHVGNQWKEDRGKEDS